MATRDAIDEVADGTEEEQHRRQLGEPDEPQRPRVVRPLIELPLDGGGQRLGPEHREDAPKRERAHEGEAKACDGLGVGHEGGDGTRGAAGGEAGRRGRWPHDAPASWFGVRSTRRGRPRGVADGLRPQAGDEAASLLSRARRLARSCPAAPDTGGKERAAARMDPLRVYFLSRSLKTFSNFSTLGPTTKRQ